MTKQEKRDILLNSLCCERGYEFICSYMHKGKATIEFSLNGVLARQKVEQFKFGAKPHAFTPKFPSGPCVYKFLDEDGILLYVGRSINMPLRMKNHRKSRNIYPWKYLIKGLEVLDCISEADMMMLEVYLIVTLNPRYNVDSATLSNTSFKLDVPEFTTNKAFNGLISTNLSE